ncbi:MAG: acyl-CoA dehydrogenase family protein [Dehalococcoidia bacterium]|nr:acyl-CoA dehydrogenase family protein [Dehalococcoidia bacterium]
MDFEFSEEDKLFRGAIRDFAQKEIAPLVEEAEEHEKFPRQLFPKAGSLGYLCIRYPEEYGGPGVGKITECIYTEELHKVCVGIAGGLMVQGSLATAPIFMNGTEQQKQDYLVPAIQGQKIGAFGLTEPNAGSDITAIETTARKDGDDYIINGVKTFITNGTFADYVVVAAYTNKAERHKGISLFLVDKGTPGFTVAKKWAKMGTRSAEAAELSFDNVRVPRSKLIGEKEGGFGSIIGTLQGGRILFGGRCVGITEAVFNMALPYAKQRVQFGKPIGKFQAIAFKLARMATELEVARSMTYRVAWMYDQKIPCMKEASMIKLFASEMAQRATWEAMQILGGTGYMREHPVERFFRDARLMTMTEGTSEVQQIVIASELGL